MRRDSSWWLLLPEPLRRLPVDLAAIAVLTILASLATVLPFVQGTYVQVGLGLTFVLFAPGYALVAALFPEEPSRGDTDAMTGIGGVTRVAFACTLSIALVSLLGLVLNVTPLGIRAGPVIGGLAATTLLLTAVAAHRRRQLPPARRLRVPYSTWWASIRETLLDTDGRLDTALSVLAVLSVLLATVSVGYVVIFPKQGQSFTEFHMLTESESGELVADEYPQNFTVGQSKSVVLGVENHEHRSMEYTAVVELQRVDVRNSSVSVRTAQELNRFSFSLADNETWRKPYAVTPTMTGGRLRLVFLLYRGDPPANPSMETAYRSLRLWVTVRNSTS